MNLICLLHFSALCLRSQFWGQTNVVLYPAPQSGWREFYRDTYGLRLSLEKKLEQLEDGLQGHPSH